MSDTHRRDDAIQAALRQVIAVTPNSHREKHLNTLTALICGIVGRRHTQWPKVAEQAPSGGAAEESLVKRFSRWLQADSVTYDTYCLPFAQAGLRALAQQPLVLIMDGSTIGRHSLALMLSVVYKGRALPLMGTVVTGKKGHFSEASHWALVAQLPPLIPKGATVIFVGDGEFDGIDLQATLDGYGWQYVCRTACNTLIWVGAVGLALTALELNPDEAVYVLQARMTARQYGPIMALARWEIGHQEPLYLVSNLNDPQVALDWYRRRFRIETFFADEKSRGFHLDQSQVSDPRRLARLLMAACLAYLWIVYLGAVAVRDGWLRWLHRTKRCDLSLFQWGLRFLARCLKEHLPLPVAFHPPIDTVA